jgi:sensor histidine kinase YesM
VVHLKIKKIGDNHIQFTLKDDGIGIEKATLEQIKATLSASNIADLLDSIENWNGRT